MFCFNRQQLLQQKYQWHKPQILVQVMRPDLLFEGSNQSPFIIILALMALSHFYVITLFPPLFSISLLGFLSINLLNWPISLNSLITLGSDFNHSLEFNLPSSLTHLSLKDRFDHPIGDFPPKLINLDLEAIYDFPIKHLPSTIKSLKLDVNRMNQNIDITTFVFPPSPTRLVLGRRFNQPLNNLPNTLTHLVLGGEFNQALEYLPSSLIPSILPWLFWQSIDSLPSKITHLSLSACFNQLIKSLPPSLTSLSFSPFSQFNQLLSCLPSNIINISFGQRFNQSVESLPPSISHVFWRKI